MIVNFEQLVSPNSNLDGYTVMPSTFFFFLLDFARQLIMNFHCFLQKSITLWKLPFYNFLHKFPSIIYIFCKNCPPGYFSLLQRYLDWAYISFKQTNWNPETAKYYTKLASVYSWFSSSFPGYSNQIIFLWKWIQLNL